MRKKTGPEVKGGTQKKSRLNPQQRAQKTQQILFFVLGIIIVLTLILSLVYR
jgi:predicted nucleic acid-binding Zn ribbon protein